MIKLPSRKIAIGKTVYEKKGFPFYEVYKDGIYIANFNGVITARKKMFGYEEDYSFPGVCEGKEEVKLEIPKVPFTLWKMIWSFYRDINEWQGRSEEHTSELQSRFDLVCRLLLEKKKK